MSWFFGGTSYTANTAVFDGTNDYLRLTSSGPTGLADGKTFTCSFWVDFAGADNNYQALFDICSAGGTLKLRIYRSNNNKITLLGLKSDDTTLLAMDSGATILAAAGWVHVYICIDLANASNRKIYFNGSAQSIAVTTYTDDTMDLVAGASAKYTVGAEGDDDGIKLNGALCEFWFDDSYLDDPTKFASGGHPISLGSDGSTPTGSAPVFYLKGSGDGFATNSGTGGNLTLTGTLGTTTPP
jgi:hypothetical protein